MNKTSITTAMKARKMANGDVQVRMTVEQFMALQKLATILNDEANINDTFYVRGKCNDKHVSCWIENDENMALLTLATSLS